MEAMSSRRTHLWLRAGEGIAHLLSVTREQPAFSTQRESRFVSPLSDYGKLCGPQAVAKGLHASLAASVFSSDSLASSQLRKYGENPCEVPFEQVKVVSLTDLHICSVEFWHGMRFPSQSV